MRNLLKTKLNEKEINFIMFDDEKIIIDSYIKSLNSVYHRKFNNPLACIFVLRNEYYGFNNYKNNNLNHLSDEGITYLNKSVIKLLKK